jgi:hypothetical protein
VRTFVDQAALFEFGEQSSPGSNGVILIKQFVGFSITKNAPIPWCAEFGCALGTNACGAVVRNSSARSLSVRVS